MIVSIIHDEPYSLEKSLMTDEELTQNANFLKSLKDPYGDWDKLIEMSES